MPSDLVETYRSQYPDAKEMSDDQIISQFLKTKTPEELIAVDPTFAQDYGYYQTRQAPAYVPPIPPASVGEHAQQFLHSGVTSQVGSFLAAPFEVASGIISGAAAPFSKAAPGHEGWEFKPEEEPIGKFGRWIDEGIGNIIPPVPQLQDSFLFSKVPAALGSAVGFMTEAGLVRGLTKGAARATAMEAAEEAGLAARIARGGQVIGDDVLAKEVEAASTAALRKSMDAHGRNITMGLGALMGGQEGYNDAIAHGASPGAVFTSMLLNAGVGLSEAIPLNKILNRIDEAVEGTHGIANYTRNAVLRRAGGEAFEEALQETFQGFSGNLIAKSILGYDKDRGLWDDVVSDGAAGGISGAVVSLIASAIGRHATRGHLKKGEDKERLPDTEQTVDTTQTGTAETTLGEAAAEARDIPEARVADEQRRKKDMAALDKEKERLRTQLDNAQTGVGGTFTVSYVAPGEEGQVNTMTPSGGINALVGTFEPSLTTFHPWSHRPGYIPETKTGEKPKSIEDPTNRFSFRAHNPLVIDMEGKDWGWMRRDQDGNLIPLQDYSPKKKEDKAPGEWTTIPQPDPTVLNQYWNALFQGAFRSGHDAVILKNLQHSGETVALPTKGQIGGLNVTGSIAVLPRGLRHQRYDPSPELATTEEALAKKAGVKTSEMTKLAEAKAGLDRLYTGLDPVVLNQLFTYALEIAGSGAVTPRLEVNDFVTAVKEQAPLRKNYLNQMVQIINQTLGKPVGPVPYPKTTPSSAEQSTSTASTAGATTATTANAAAGETTAATANPAGQTETANMSAFRAQQLKETQAFAEILKNGASLRNIITLFEREKTPEEIAELTGIPLEQILAVKSHLNIPDLNLKGTNKRNPDFGTWRKKTIDTRTMLEREEPRKPTAVGKTAEGKRVIALPERMSVNEAARVESATQELNLIREDEAAEKEGRMGRKKLSYAQQLAKEAYTRGYTDVYDIHAALRLAAETDLGPNATGDTVKERVTKVADKFFPTDRNSARVSAGQALHTVAVVNGEITDDASQEKLAQTANELGYKNLDAFIRDAQIVAEAVGDPKLVISNPGGIGEHTIRVIFSRGESPSRTGEVPRQLPERAGPGMEEWALLQGQQPHINLYEVLAERADEALQNADAGKADPEGESLVEFLSQLDDTEAASGTAFTAIDLANIDAGTDYQMHDAGDRLRFIRRVRYDRGRANPKTTQFNAGHPGQRTFQEFRNHPLRNQWLAELGSTMKFPDPGTPKDGKLTDKQVEHLREMHRKAVIEALDKEMVVRMDVLNEPNLQDQVARAKTLRNTLTQRRSRARKEELKKEDVELASSVELADSDEATSQNIVDSVRQHTKRGGLVNSLKGLGRMLRNLYNAANLEYFMSSWERGRREKVARLRDLQRRWESRGITQDNLDDEVKDFEKEKRYLRGRFDAIGLAYKRAGELAKRALEQVKIAVDQQGGKSGVAKELKKELSRLQELHEKYSRANETQKELEAEAQFDETRKLNLENEIDRLIEIVRRNKRDKSPDLEENRKKLKARKADFRKMETETPRALKAREKGRQNLQNLLEQTNALREKLNKAFQVETDKGHLPVQALAIERDAQVARDELGRRTKEQDNLSNLQKLLQKFISGKEEMTPEELHYIVQNALTPQEKGQALTSNQEKLRAKASALLDRFKKTHPTIVSQFKVTPEGHQLKPVEAEGFVNDPTREHIALLQLYLSGQVDNFSDAQRVTLAGLLGVDSSRLQPGAEIARTRLLKLAPKALQKVEARLQELPDQLLDLRIRLKNLETRAEKTIEGRTLAKAYEKNLPSQRRRAQEAHNALENARTRKGKLTKARQKEINRLQAVVNMEEGKLKKLLQSIQQAGKGQVTPEAKPESQAYRDFIAALDSLQQVQEERLAFIREHGETAKEIDDEFKESLAEKKKEVADVKKAAQKMAEEIRIYLASLYDPVILRKLESLGYSTDWWDSGDMDTLNRQDRRDLKKLQKWREKNPALFQAENPKAPTAADQEKMDRLRVLEEAAQPRKIGLINIPVRMVYEHILPKNIPANQLDVSPSSLWDLPYIAAITSLANKRWTRYQEAQKQRQATKDSPLNSSQLDIEGSPMEGESETVEKLRAERVERVGRRKAQAKGEDVRQHIRAGIQLSRRLAKEKARAEKRRKSYAERFRLYVGESDVGVPASIIVNGGHHYGDKAQQLLDEKNYIGLGFILSDGWQDPQGGVANSHRIVAFDVPVPPGQPRKILMANIYGTTDKDGFPDFRVIVGTTENGRAVRVSLSRMIQLGFRPVSSYRTIDPIRNYAYLYENYGDFKRDWGDAHAKQQEHYRFLLRGEQAAMEFWERARAMSDETVEWNPSMVSHEAEPELDGVDSTPEINPLADRLEGLAVDPTTGEIIMSGSSEETHLLEGPKGESETAEEGGEQSIAQTLAVQLQLDPTFLSTQSEAEREFTYQRGDEVTPTSDHHVRWGEEARGVIANVVIGTALENPRESVTDRTARVVHMIFESDKEETRETPEDYQRRQSITEAAFMAGDQRELRRQERADEKQQHLRRFRHVLKQARIVAQRYVLKRKQNTGDKTMPTPEEIDAQARVLLTYAIKFAQNSALHRKRSMPKVAGVMDLGEREYLDDGDWENVQRALGTAWTRVGELGALLVSDVAPVNETQGGVSTTSVGTLESRVDVTDTVLSGPTTSSDGKTTETVSDAPTKKDDVETLFTKRALTKHQSVGLTTEQSGEHFMPSEVEKIRNQFGHGDPVTGVLKFMSTLKDFPMPFRVLARALLRSGIVSKIRYINDPRLNFKGRYDLGKDEIVINLAHHYARDSRGPNVPDVGLVSVFNTILEESIHSAIAKLLYFYYTPGMANTRLTVEQHKAITMIRQLMLTAAERGFFDLKKYRSEMEALNEYAARNMTDVGFMGRLSLEQAPPTTVWGNGTSGLSSRFISMLHSFVESVKGLVRSFLSSMKTDAYWNELLQSGPYKDVALRTYNAREEQARLHVTMLDRGVEGIFNLISLRRQDKMRLDSAIGLREALKDAKERGNTSEAVRLNDRLNAAADPVQEWMESPERYLMRGVDSAWQRGFSFDPPTDAGRQQEAELRTFVTVQNELREIAEQFFASTPVPVGTDPNSFTREKAAQLLYQYRKGTDSTDELTKRALAKAQELGVPLSLSEEGYRALRFGDLEASTVRPYAMRQVADILHEVELHLAKNIASGNDMVKAQQEEIARRKKHLQVQILAASQRDLLDRMIHDSLVRAGQAFEGRRMSPEEIEAATLEAFDNVANELGILDIDRGKLMAELARMRATKTSRDRMATRLSEIARLRPTAANESVESIRHWMRYGDGTTQELHNIAIDDLQSIILLSFIKRNRLLMETMGQEKLSSEDRAMLNETLRLMLANQSPVYVTAQGKNLGRRLRRHARLLENIQFQLAKAIGQVNAAERTLADLENRREFFLKASRPLSEIRQKFDDELGIEVNYEFVASGTPRTRNTTYQFSAHEGEQYVVPKTDAHGDLVPNQSIDDIVDPAKADKEKRVRTVDKFHATPESRAKLVQDIYTIKAFILEQEVKARAQGRKAGGRELNAMRRWADELTKVQAGWANEAAFGRRGWVPKMLSSMAMRLNINHPAPRRIRQRIRFYDDVLRRLADTAEVDQFTITKDLAIKATGRPMSVFNRLYMDLPLGFIETQKDILAANPKATLDQLTEIGMNAMIRFLRTLPQAKHDLESNPGLEGALKTMWRAHTKIVSKANEVRRDAKLKILDQRTPDLGYYFRESIGHPLWYSPRQLDGVLLESIKNANRSVEWQALDFIVIDRKTGEPMVAEDGSIVRARKMNRAGVAYMYREDRNKLFDIIKKRFSGGLTESFIIPILQKYGATKFMTPQDRDGHSSQMPREARIGAFHAANGDLLTAAEILYERFGHKGEEGRAEFIGEFFEAIQKYWNSVVSYSSDAPTHDDDFLKNIDLPKYIMDGRTDLEFPPEWLNYFQHTREHWRNVVNRLAMNAAFGTGGIGLRADINTTLRHLESLIKAWDNIKDLPKGEQEKYLRDNRFLGTTIEDAKNAETTRGDVLKVKATLNAIGLSKNVHSDEKTAYAFLRLIAELAVQGAKTSLVDTSSIIDGALRHYGFTGFGFLGGTAKHYGHEILGTFFQSFGRQLALGNDAQILPILNSTLGYGDTDALHSLRERWRAIDMSRETSGAVRAIHKARAVLMAPLQVRGKRPTGEKAYVGFRPLAPFSMASLWAIRAVTRQYFSTYTVLVNAATDYMRNHPREASQRGFQFTPEMLSKANFLPTWLNNKGALSKLIFHLSEHGISLEELARRQANGDIWQEDVNIVQAIGSLASSEIMLERSFSDTPAWMTHGMGGYIAPLLRWSFQRSNEMVEMFHTPEGKRDYKAFIGGLVSMAAVVLPTSLLYAFLRDWYDDELLGKKSNELPLRFSGEDAWRSWFDAVSRVGTLGFAGDMANQLVNFNTAREFSVDNRVFFVNSVLGLIRASNRLVNQGGAVTWDSVGRPIAQAAGASGFLQNFDVIFNLTGADNAETRTVRRIHVNNLLRASAIMTPDMEVRPPFQGTYRPTRATPWVTQMVLSAYANDRKSFYDAYRKAIAAAANDGAEDPLEAVSSSYAARNPLKALFMRPPTVKQYHEMLETMGTRNGATVEEAIRNYNTFGSSVVKSSKRQLNFSLSRLPQPTGLTPYYGRTPAVSVNAFDLMGFERPF